MRTTLDFSPLFRTGIGFDRVFDVLDSAARVQPFDNWPPYDIVKQGEDTYRIVMAVAGFDRDELTLTDRPNLLVVAGARKGDSQEGTYLHKGIAEREFERRFELADHVKVAHASLANGLLTIDLQREIPESLKPRRIEIRDDGSQDAPRVARQIDAPKVA
ncbi:molecular chaperone Hsp20 [Frateuria sp. Soil773]|uniref:Hsp20 family protein n=1 Tax=Frateuria sp. Soil773 TaxID=1736407 RepID=UPI000700D49C|nr:Hsp20 family protein [Frateuria sp. Soil773]KRE89065.1 molecular chaperone Hsp20 [Frateuria sp. Soil773]